MTTKVETPDDLASFVGKELGTSAWVDVAGRVPLPKLIGQPKTLDA
jgi:hypothetical protein